MEQFKGTVSRYFDPPRFFFSNRPCKSPDSHPKIHSNTASNSSRSSAFNVVRRGLIPPRTGSRGLIPHKTLFHRLSGPTGFYSAGIGPCRTTLLIKVCSSSIYVYNSALLVYNFSIYVYHSDIHLQIFNIHIHLFNKCTYVYNLPMYIFNSYENVYHLSMAEEP
jgi:hypothetical protein